MIESDPSHPRPDAARDRAREALDADLRSSALNGRRVLVLEDDPDSSRFQRFAFATQKASVVVCTTAREALGAVKRTRFDLLVVDVVLPDMHGDEFLIAARRIRPGLKRIPALALTGYGSLENRLRMHDAGFSACLYKPCDAQTLIRRATQLVAERFTDIQGLP